MNTRKAYVIGDDLSYINWMEADPVSQMERADFVVATGGEDVTPARYDEPKHPLTFNNPRRDDAEFAEFYRAIKLGKPLVGICRGSQAMCVLAGGKLVQHQRNPGNHLMDIPDGDGMFVTSTHHQAQWPWNLPSSQFRLLGWTTGISPYHYGGNQKEIVIGKAVGDREVEICYYPIIKALAIQFHPEYVLYNDDFKPLITYVRGLLAKLLAGTL
jgi:putative glutamine amidotransferase